MLENLDFSQIGLKRIYEAIIDTVRTLANTSRNEIETNKVQRENEKNKIQNSYLTNENEKNK